MPEGEQYPLVINHTEIIHELPVGLRYFMAVDAMTEGVKPIDRIYQNIQVYGPNNDPQYDQPSVTILRILANYQGGNTGKQDELELQGMPYRMQFNAETTQDGTYIQFPQQVSQEGMEYLDGVVATFTDLAAIDGSYIRINNRIRMIAFEGIWVSVDDSQNGLPKPQDGHHRTGSIGQDAHNGLPGPSEYDMPSFILQWILNLKNRRKAGFTPAGD